MRHAADVAVVLRRAGIVSAVLVVERVGIEFAVVGGPDFGRLYRSADVVGVRERQGIAELHGPYAAGRVIIIVRHGDLVPAAVLRINVGHAAKAVVNIPFGNLAVHAVRFQAVWVLRRRKDFAAGLLQS